MIKVVAVLFLDFKDEKVVKEIFKSVRSSFPKEIEFRAGEAINTDNRRKPSVYIAGAEGNLLINIEKAVTKAMEKAGFKVGEWKLN